MDKSIKDIKVNVGPMGINDFFPDISNVTLHEIQCYSCIAGDQGLQNHAMSIRKYNECISGTIKHSVYYPLGYLTVEDVSIFKDVKFETCFKIEELRHGNFIFVYCGSIEDTDTVIFRLFGGDGGYDPYNYYTSIINTFLPVLDKLTITNDDYKFVLPTNKISTEYKQEDWFMLDNNYRIKLKIPVVKKSKEEVQDFINKLKEDITVGSNEDIKIKNEHHVITISLNLEKEKLEYSVIDDSIGKVWYITNTITGERLYLQNLGRHKYQRECHFKLLHVSNVFTNTILTKVDLKRWIYDNVLDEYQLCTLETKEISSDEGMNIMVVPKYSITFDNSSIRKNYRLLGCDTLDDIQLDLLLNMSYDKARSFALHKMRGTKGTQGYDEERSMRNLPYEIDKIMSRDINYILYSIIG